MKFVNMLGTSLRDKLYVRLQRMANHVDPYRAERFNGVTLVVQSTVDGKIVNEELCAACKYCGSPTQTMNRVCGRCNC